jgi:mannan endo-1,4-beta-mannosidase
MREAIKGRLAFASDRWGGSGALFAWDIWNEIHPAHGGDDPAHFMPFITDISTFLRDREQARYGRAHPQTVSIFGPELINHPATVDPVFRHPDLDFASTHLYEKGTIDNPRDTVAPALSTARLIQAAVREATDLRPVHDSEHGPIHAFKDRHRILPEPFDDEYFRHMQWAHLASGGAGGGMRWPNRHPHVLTVGMRRAQGALARFLPLIDWTSFKRRNISDELDCDDPHLALIGCGDDGQAVIWLLSTGPLAADKRLADREAKPVKLTVPGLKDGSYRTTLFSTEQGEVTGTCTAQAVDRKLTVTVPVARDLALAIAPFS